MKNGVPHGLASAIITADRRVGESKMSGSIVVEAMLQVPELRWHALRGTL